MSNKFPKYVEASWRAVLLGRPKGPRLDAEHEARLRMAYFAGANAVSRMAEATPEFLPAIREELNEFLRRTAELRDDLEDFSGVEG